MNSQLKDMAKVLEPKIQVLQDAHVYRSALQILASHVSEEFLDLPVINGDRYDLIDKLPDGAMFYEIPFFHSDTLFTNGNKIDLLLVCEITERSLLYRTRISFDYIHVPCEVSKKYPTGMRTNYWIYLHDQSGQKTIKHELVSYTADGSFTQVPGFQNMKLSEMATYKYQP